MPDDLPPIIPKVRKKLARPSGTSKAQELSYFDILSFLCSSTTPVSSLTIQAMRCLTTKVVTAGLRHLQREGAVEEVSVTDPTIKYKATTYGREMLSKRPSARPKESLIPRSNSVFSLASAMGLSNSKPGTL